MGVFHGYSLWIWIDCSISKFNACFCFRDIPTNHALLNFRKPLSLLPWRSGRPAKALPTSKTEWRIPTRRMLSSRSSGCGPALRNDGLRSWRCTMFWTRCASGWLPPRVGCPWRFFGYAMVWAQAVSSDCGHHDQRVAHWRCAVHPVWLPAHSDPPRLVLVTIPIQMEGLDHEQMGHLPTGTET